MPSVLGAREKSKTSVRLLAAPRELKGQRSLIWKSKNKAGVGWQAVCTMVKQAAGSRRQGLAQMVGAGSAPGKAMATRSLGICGAARPGVPHGSPGTGPSFHRGPWLGSTERFDGTAVIFGVIPAGPSAYRAGAEGALQRPPGPLAGSTPRSP